MKPDEWEAAVDLLISSTQEKAQQLMEQLREQQSPEWREFHKSLAQNPKRFNRVLAVTMLAKYTQRVIKETS